LVRVAELSRGQSVRVEPEYGEVGERIRADDLEVLLVAVGERGASRWLPSTTCAEVRTKPSGVITTPLPPPSRRPRETRRFATEGESFRATSVTTREYASSGAS
jgi:hypothetical protein